LFFRIHQNNAWDTVNACPVLEGVSRAQDAGHAYPVLEGVSRAQDAGHAYPVLEVVDVGRTGTRR